MAEDDRATIGNMNGPWAALLKVLLICFVPWSTYITVESILSRQFRGAGPRFTPADAQILINAHASMPGHSVMDARVTRLEMMFEQIRDVEAEETEILREIAETLRNQ